MPMEEKLELEFDPPPKPGS